MDRDKVYVNRTLNLKKIKYIGLDMDHTLIRYNSYNFEELAHEVMLSKLINDFSYPSELGQLKFQYERSIRGLVIDVARGNILKLSRHGGIRVSYHGLDLITYDQQKRLYKSTYVDLSDPKYDTVDTAFSIAIAGLYAQLVDAKDKQFYNELPDYNTLWEDLNRCLDRAHRDGSLKDEVAKDLDRFIIKSPEVVSGLERFIKHNKKIFVLTNSDYHYTKLLLDYAINPFLKDHKHWSELFDLVITSAQKPRFFFDNLKFLKVDPEDGSMQNMTGPLGRGIYQGGCAAVFTNDLNLKGDDILYLGDHIYGDIVRLKKDCAWRTALIVEELATEIEKVKRAEPVVAQIDSLMAKKLPIEKTLDNLISQKIENGEESDDPRIKELLTEISVIDKEISAFILQQQEIFNPHWGEVMRVGIEESYFAHQVERYACIYMSELKDFLQNSPRTYYRSRRRPMAHDLA